MAVNALRCRQYRPACMGGALALALSPALASGAEPQAGKVVELPTVVVTGSHIRRVQLETEQPLLVLDHADLQRTGLGSVGEILQQLPLHGSDLNTDYNNGGNGETRVDLRNLGAQRTLVLLDGHRYVTALDGAVDVGSIPVSIVDRIEVLTDGASAIYGSDAIAGVVNIITRRNYKGVEAGASYASNAHGDGQRRTADLTWGASNARSNIVLNLAFADQQPIWAGDRAISAVPHFGLPPGDVLIGASPVTPNGRIGFGPGGNQLPDGSEDQLTWDPMQHGYRAFDWRNDGYNYAPENYLRTPYQRTALFAHARYDFHPNLSVHTDLLVHKRRSRQQLAPTPLFQFGAGGDPGNYDIATDNLYNPFGEPVTFFAFRPLNRPRIFQQDVLTTYLSLGLDGMFEFGSRHFSWDANWIEARMRKSQTQSGGYNLDRLGLGVGPSFSDVSGNPRCGTPSIPIADCVPLDFLHGRDGFTDAMFDYLAVSGAVEVTRQLRDVTFDVSGDLFDLPAGALSLAAGVEQRREGGRVALSQELRNSDFSGDVPNPVDGTVRVNEAYVEIKLPLLAKRPWAQALELSLATRYSNYSTFGSTSNSKIGVLWRPSADWLLRATWSQGYRAPSTSELYGTSESFQTNGYAVGLDPCAPVNHPTGIVAQRCAAAGVPPDFDPQLGPSIRVGSNPELQPEPARNRNLGVVWSPHAIAGLDVSLDWWRIKLDDSIDEIGEDMIPSLCYVEGASRACDQLSRDPRTGRLTMIDTRLHNYGLFDVEGYDLGLGYHWQNAWGEFHLRSDSTYFSHYFAEIPKDAPPVSLPGNYFTWNPSWRWRSLLSLDWDRNTFGASVRLRYYPSLDESCNIPLLSDRLDLCDRPDLQSPTFNGNPEHIIASRTYTDLQLRWKPHEGIHLSVGLDNAFDQDPPLAYSSFANSYDPSYDVPGRFWYLRYQQSW